MVLVERVLGDRADPEMAQRLHRLEHRGQVDIVCLRAEELGRRRFRAVSEGGREVGIALGRADRLFDGAVLLLDDGHALLLRVEVERWLRLLPKTTQDAIQLGYHAGNLHWRVRFDGDALLVALERPLEEYIERVGGLVAEGRVGYTVVTEP